LKKRQQYKNYYQKVTFLDNMRSDYSKQLNYKKVAISLEELSRYYLCFFVMLSILIVNYIQLHTVAIWTFTFHKITGFWRVILKANFKQFCRPKLSIFFIWKFRFIILIFLLVFAEFVKSTALYTLLLLFQRVDISSKSPLQSLIVCEM